MIKCEAFATSFTGARMLDYIYHACVFDVVVVVVVVDLLVFDFVRQC